MLSLEWVVSCPCILYSDYSRWNIPQYPYAVNLVLKTTSTLMISMNRQSGRSTYQLNYLYDRKDQILRPKLACFLLLGINV